MSNYLQHVYFWKQSYSITLLDFIIVNRIPDAIPSIETLYQQITTLIRSGKSIAEQISVAIQTTELDSDEEGVVAVDLCHLWGIALAEVHAWQEISIQFL